MYILLNEVDMCIDLIAIKQYFDTNVTRQYLFRLQQLNRLKTAIKYHEEELINALTLDLNKPEIESYISEIGIVYSEINHAIAQLKNWMKLQKVRSPISLFYSKSYIVNVPLGVVLIIAPWNYPLQLLLSPLVGAIASGNCVVLKPSEYTPHVAHVLEKIIQLAFKPNYISLIIGNGATIIPQLLKNFTFNYVFFTGSTAVGQSIAQLCAAKLTPYTLELGGKSPAIIDKNVNLKVACKRIAWAKFLNSGQTCVAPDYIIVDIKIKEQFINCLITTLQEMYPTWQNLSRIINREHFNRIISYLSDTDIIYGGQSNPDQLSISPTLINEPSLEHPIMQNEIFGPILPIISYTVKQDIQHIIAKNHTPLALYVFSKDKIFSNDIIQNIAFGGGCINTALVHLINPNLPFGGIMTSGHGNYHGKYSFNTFSHQKSIVNMASWLDIWFKYPPYTRVKKALLKKFIGK